MSDKRVTLIQCTDSKRNEPAPARDLYDESRYFRRMREWAEAFNAARDQPWYILSAKHGLVAPGDVLEPYDERGLSGTQAKDIAATLSDQGVTTVDVTAGRDYTDDLVPALEKRHIDVVNHFAGERIGTREKLLQEASERLTGGNNDE